MNLINLKTMEYPCSLWQVRQANPNVSFPAEPTDDDLAPFDHANVHPSPQPTEYNHRTQRVEEGAPVLVDGRFQQVWYLRSANEDEISSWDEAHAPQPRWAEFSEVLMADSEINQMLGSVMNAAPAIYGGLVVGLSEISKGNSPLFLSAWNGATQLVQVSPEVVASLKATAAAHDLPRPFIDALA